MKFGSVAVAGAEGAILAHSHRLGSGRVLKKGQVLTATECRALAAAGLAEVLVARVEEGDVGEDAAAGAVAHAVAGSRVTVGRATTGRANLFSSVRGVFVASRADIDACNAVDDAITVATLPPYAVVGPGDMVATVKIIPFAVPGERVACACACAALRPPLLDVAPFTRKRVGLVLTTLPGGQEATLDRAAGNQRARVERLGGELAGELRVDHSRDGVARAIAALLDDRADVVLVLGASAIVDRHDVVPSALEAVGGVVEHLGMPVDPGNLLLLGRRGSIPVVGVPGCARSLKRSGFDWVLERIMAGVSISRGDVVSLGAGGLLDAARAPSSPGAGTTSRSRPPSRVAAIVLAAGTSRRMAGTNKLLATMGDRPLVAGVVDAVLGAGADPVVVVVGHQAAEVRAALGGRPVRFVENAAYAEGLGSSLRAGVESLEDDVDATLVVLGDMPWLRHDHVRTIIDAFDPNGASTICVPVHERKRGHPVLFSSRHFAEMRELGGDVGARAVIERHASSVATVAIDDAGVLVDVDTPEMLAGARAGLSTAPARGDRA
jgi:molybdenum cofactor cytidylyltransferase